MTQTGFAFDVGTVLGIGPNPLPLPEAAEGEILLRITERLSLRSLRDSPVGQELMHAQDWYEKYGWSREEIPPGIYRLRIPVANSYGKTFPEQQKLLIEGETVAPVAAIAAALLCMQRTGQSDPLVGRWTRCAEATVAGYRVALDWSDGRLLVIGSSDDCRSGLVGLSSLRKTS